MWKRKDNVAEWTQRKKIKKKNVKLYVIKT